MRLALLAACVNYGDYDEAEKHFRELNKQLESSNNTSLKTSLLFIHALLAAKQKHWEATEDYYSKACASAGFGAVSSDPIFNMLASSNRLDQATRLIHPSLPRLPQGERPVTALIISARSATMFFHSLWDNHPQISTLPGVYFTAWFSPEVVKLLRPNLSSPRWRQELCDRIFKTFEPFFNPASRGNVPGQPFGETQILGFAQGFLSLGKNQDLPLNVDREVFGQALFARLRTLNDVSHAQLFEMVHDAADEALGREVDPSRHILYHIHNPKFPSALGFAGIYPKARVLQMVREPVQALESWLMTQHEMSKAEIVGDKKAQRAFYSSIWFKQALLICNTFNGLSYPFRQMLTCGGVRMEDVKRHPHEIMPRVAEWMGVDDHPALYESTFGGLEYFGPASTSTKIVSGFDTASIDHKRGRLFSERDIEIFDTLFWPFAHMYGYTDMDKAAFRARLRDIKPRLDKPLDFEQALYDRLPKPGGRFQTLYGFRQLHEVLKNAHAVLTRDETYEAMIPPLAVIR